MSVYGEKAAAAGFAVAVIATLVLAVCGLFALAYVLGVILA